MVHNQRNIYLTMRRNMRMVGRVFTVMSSVCQKPRAEWYYQSSIPKCLCFALSSSSSSSNYQHITRCVVYDSHRKGFNSWTMYPFLISSSSGNLTTNLDRLVWTKFSSSSCSSISECWSSSSSSKNSSFQDRSSSGSPAPAAAHHHHSSSN